MNPKPFSEWLNHRTFREVAYSHLNFDPNLKVQSQGNDPYMKVKLPERPTFRDADRAAIMKHSRHPGSETPEKEQIEHYLDKVTARIGLHWIIIWDDINYMGKSPEGATLHRPAYPTIATPQGAVPVDPRTGGMMNATGKTTGPLNYSTRTKMSIEDWTRNEEYKPLLPGEAHPFDRDAYFQRAYTMGKDLLTNPGSQFQQLAAKEGMDASPSNTIVVSKATSRVHNLTPWLMMHNIGHAVWDHCTHQFQMFQDEIQRVIIELQQSHYDPGGKPPSNNEVVVMLSRMLDAKQIHKNFTDSPKDATNPAKALNSFIGGVKELFYDLIAFYIRSGGNIRLSPRAAYQGEKPSDQAPDRRGDMQRAPAFDDPAVIAAGGEVRDWAYKAIAAEPQKWREAGKSLTKVVDGAMRNCVWANTNGPIICHDLITVA